MNRNKNNDCPPISGPPSCPPALASSFHPLSSWGGKDQGNGRLTPNYIKVFNESGGLAGGCGTSL